MHKSKPEIIYFCGVWLEDIVLYLAFLASRLQIRILVCDQTSEGLVYRCIKKPEHAPEIVRFEGVDYTTGVQKENGSYEMIFLVADFETAFSRNCDRYFWVCDGSYGQVIRLAELLKKHGNHTEGRECVLFRNLFHVHSPALLKNRIGEEYFGRMKMDYLEHDCIQEEQLDRLCYEKFSFIPRLSGEYERLLVKLACDLFHVDKRQIKKRMGKKKGGRRIDCSILGS